MSKPPFHDGSRKRRPFRGLPPRGSKAVSNGKQPTPIERAIDAAQQPAPVRPDADVRGLMIAHEPVRLTPKARVQVTAPQNPDATLVLIHDPQAQCWRPIVLPPGTHWSLQLDEQPRPALWLPPGARA